MEAKLRRLFAAKSTSKNHGNPNLTGTSYETTTARQEPVRGTYPVTGNGPKPLDQFQRRRSKTNDAFDIPIEDEPHAPAPYVPRTRRDSYRARPVTAPQSVLPSGQLEGPSYARTRSGFSVNSPPNFSRKPSPAESLPTPEAFNKQIHHDPERAGAQSAKSSATSHSRAGSAYVDLFDAVSAINPSRSTSRQRASGKRDYGEDVADRNIADFGGVDLDSPQYNYLRAVFARDRRNVADQSRVALHKRDTSARGHSSGDGAGDDTLSMQPLHPNPKNRSAGHSRTNSPQISLHQPITSTTSSRIDNYVDRSNPSAKSSTSPPLSPIFQDQFTSGPTLRSHRASVASTKSYIPSGRSQSGSIIVSDSRIPATGGGLPRTAQGSSFNPRTSSIPKVQFTVDPVVLAARTAIANRSPHLKPLEVKSFPLAPPVPQLNLAKIRNQTRTLPTPPMSPILSQSPASPGTKDTIVSLPSTPLRETTRTAVTGDSSHGDNKHSGVVFDSEMKGPSLSGVVDHTNTTDTEFITHQLPSVTHEYITPIVNHSREEVITRERHTHDVFHRVQPVVDVEVLPTKHYAPHATDPSTLVELRDDKANSTTSSGVVPGRQNHWAIVVNDQLQQTGDISRKSTGSTVGSLSGSKSRNTDPILQSQRTRTSADGHPKTDYVWIHPPELESAPPSHTQRLIINHSDSGEESNSPSTPLPAVGEEDLLFKESGYGAGGMLPGLEEMSPMILPGNSPALEHSQSKSVPSVQPMQTSPIPESRPCADSSGRGVQEGEATRALRRRAGTGELSGVRDLTRKIGSMGL